MLPRVILHCEVSVDGRIDWFEMDIAQFYELTARFNEDATLVGSDTLLAALPADDVVKDNEGTGETFQEDPSDTRPLLVVPDSRGRVRNLHLLRKEKYWRNVLSLCSDTTPVSHLEYLRSNNIDFIKIGDDRVEFRAALEEINRRHRVETVRVDSGGMLNGVLLREGLVDEVSVLVSPFLVGGTTPRSFFRAPDLTSPEGVISLELKSVEEAKGGVVWLRYDVIR